MVSKDLILTVEGAENGTNDIPTFSLDELNRCRGQLLGGGAFGKVYAIEGFPDLAVKEIWLKGQPDRLVEITKFELEALSQFSHPGVLKYHQVLAKGEFFYVVMDRYDGDLQHFIADHRMTHEPIPRELLLSILKQLADALSYVHAPYKVNERGDVLPGIVHRDLKPANVLMSRNGEHVAIADFGLCKDAQHDGITFAGSPSYMAPEVFIHRKTSRASDIWSLGVIAYELATLERPSFSHHWEPEDAKEFFVPEWKPDLSAIEDDFIRRILERIFVLDPEKRPTAGDIAILFQTLSTSASEPGAQNSLLNEGHRPYVALNDTNSKAKSSWTPLMSAAAAGDIKAVKKHLSKEGKKDNRKDIALVLAARVGHKDIVELLDPTDENGVTALMRAAARGDAEVVELLIPIQKEMKDKHGNTAFMHALKTKHEDIATILGEHEAPSWTPLMCAAFIGDVETAKRHLNEMDERNSDGDTAYTLAVKAGQGAIVEILDPTDEKGVTALMRAAERGDVDTVRALIPLQKKRKADYVDVYGWFIFHGTALMRATYRGHTEVVELLVEHEGGMKDENDQTALMIAVENGHTECVRLLVEKEDGMQDKDGRTALMFATIYCHIECVKLLAEKEAGMKDNCDRIALVHATQNDRRKAAELLMEHEKDILGWTNLICAAYLGDVDAVKSILHKKGCKDITGMTALMWAAYQGHKEVVEILLEHEKGIRDNERNTAFMHALKNKHEDIALLLREHEASSWTFLMCAAFIGDIELAKSHLSDKDKKNSDGETALILAARAGHEDIIELIAPTSRSGVTALMRAAGRGDVEAVKVLTPLQKGRKTDYLCSSKTALMRAAACGHVEVVKLLVEYEGGMQDKDGWTALMSAATSGYLECVRSLLNKEQGKKTKYKETALMLAARNGHTDCVQLLVDYESGTQKDDGVDALVQTEATKCPMYLSSFLRNEGLMVDYREWLDPEQISFDVLSTVVLMNDGMTALMYAAERGHTECVKLLVEKEGCMRKKNGETALIFAAKSGHTECVKLLMEREGYVSGWTELICAAYRGDVNGVRNNIHMKGARDVRGWTALMYATKQRHTEIVELLAKHEGGMKNNKGMTARMLAIGCRHSPIADLLAKYE